MIRWLNYTELETLANALELEFYECSEACLECHGRNSFSFNRLFAVWQCREESNWLRNVRTGQVMPMRANCLYWIANGTDLEFEFHENTRFFAFHFNIRLLHCQELLRADELFCEIPGRRETVREIERLYHEAVFSAATICRLKSIFFRELAPFLTRADLSGRRAIFIRYRDLLKFIHTKATAKTVVGDLTAWMAMSQDTLSRHFSRDFGMPLKRYLSGALAARAELLLRDPELKVREVARQLGFHDEYYFSKFFRRETGAAPSEFRRLLNHAVNAESSGETI